MPWGSQHSAGPWAAAPRAAADGASGSRGRFRLARGKCGPIRSSVGGPAVRRDAFRGSRARTDRTGSLTEVWRRQRFRTACSRAPTHSLERARPHLVGRLSPSRRMVSDSPAGVGHFVPDRAAQHLLATPRAVQHLRRLQPREPIQARRVERFRMGCREWLHSTGRVTVSQPKTTWKLAPRTWLTTSQVFGQSSIVTGSSGGS